MRAVVEKIETLYCEKCGIYKSVEKIEINRFRGKPFQMEITLICKHEQVYNLRVD